jgi:hypothetical protein
MSAKRLSLETEVRLQGRPLEARVIPKPSSEIGGEGWRPPETRPPRQLRSEIGKTWATDPHSDREGTSSSIGPARATPPSKGEVELVSR